MLNGWRKRECWFLWFFFFFLPQDLRWIKMYANCFCLLCFANVSIFCAPVLEHFYLFFWDSSFLCFLHIFSEQLCNALNRKDPKVQIAPKNSPKKGGQKTPSIPDKPLLINSILMNQCEQNTLGLPTHTLWPCCLHCLIWIHIYLTKLELEKQIWNNHTHICPLSNKFHTCCVSIALKKDMKKLYG